MVNLPCRNLAEGKVLGIMQDKVQAVKLRQRLFFFLSIFFFVNEFMFLSSWAQSCSSRSQWEFTFPFQGEDIKPSVTYFWTETKELILKPSRWLADPLKSVDKTG